MSAGTVKAQFGNCLHCKNYAKLDVEQICPQCSSIDLDLLGKAARLTQGNKEITTDEIAAHLDISVERVSEWVKQGKIRCVTIQYVCPTCNRDVVNQFTCTYCGYTPSLSPIGVDRKRIRSALAEGFLKERFSKERKKPSQRERLLSSLPGILTLNSNES